MEASQSGARVWSTIGNHDGFAHWREVVCQAFTKLSPERLDERPFAGEIRLSAFCQSGTVSQIRAGPQLVRRRARDVVERPCDSVFVNFQLAGTSVVRQRGMETSLGPGTFVVLDARQPFDMRFDGAFRQACMHLPLESLETRGFDPAGAICRTVGREHAFGAALIDGVAALLESEHAESSDDFLVQLLQLSFSGDRSDTLADRHLKHIRRFVAHHCDEPDMTPAAVATHFRISVRYLHKLFARSGLTFGRFLLRSRLRRARTALLLHPHRPVLDIALESGFQSGSHFARSFRREFGVTPTQMRRRSSTADEAWFDFSSAEDGNGDGNSYIW